MKIYLDDNLDNDELIGVLTTNGFDVISPRSIRMRHKSDLDHMRCAIVNGAILLTYNYYDFYQLHKKSKPHFGIVVIYQYNNPKKDMAFYNIVRALKNLEEFLDKYDLKIENQLYKLNDFNY